MQSLIVLVKGFQQTRVQHIWLHNSLHVLYPCPWRLPCGHSVLQAGWSHALLRHNGSHS